MTGELEIQEKTVRPEDIQIDPPLKNIEGVKHSIALRIEKMLKAGRRYFGSSGAAMTHQAFNPEYAEKGVQPNKAKEYLDGERDTTTFLKQWIEDKPGVVMVDSIRVPDWDKDEVVNEDTGIIDGGDTDHILLVGTEVIIMDTKRWPKKKNYSVNNDGDALMTNKPFAGGQVTMKESIHKWLNYLDEDAFVTGIVYINSEDVSVLRNRNWYTQDYRLVELKRFEELLNEKWKMIEDYDKTHINSTLVSQVVVSCIKPFDTYAKVFDMKTLAKFR